MPNTPLATDRLWVPGTPPPYDDVIDVRSPAEFAADHVPGSVNLPVLTDPEHAAVGTVYRQVSAFAARRLGAGLVSANIGRHLAGHFADKPAGYRPFVYCWRGGQRSAAMATVLAAVGWRVTVLAGGYKTYRAHIRRHLDGVPSRYTFRVVAGATGAGKTRLLHRLAARGAQVLDLEGLAGHRGSVLGGAGPQPPQKLFESRLLDALGRHDPGRPVWVEAESHRVGDRSLPASLWDGMRAAAGVEVRVPRAARVECLIADYPHWPTDPVGLAAALGRLAVRHGPRRVAAWRALIDAGDWAALVDSLLTVHYDPGYAASARKSFPHVTHVVEVGDPTPEAIDRVAGELLAGEGG